MIIEEVALHFPMDGAPLTCEEFGSGHINHTYKISTDSGRVYILQRINHFVFKEPAKVMANATAVTDFILKKTGNEDSALRFLPADNGLYYYVDDAGYYWRMYRFVEGFCLNAPESPADFYESALAFGQFQNLLSDFPADTLYETIPEFHNTVDRYRQLKESIAADPVGRAATVAEEIRFALEHEAIGGTLQQMREAGELPLRVTHNDTKLNNVLLRKEDRKSLCVLDLDTIMPGLSLYDFGDSIRFGAATAAEDEKDPSKMKLDTALFAVYTKGFLETATSLTDREVEMLPMGALIMTLEVGIRFLKDYLDGDVYFKTAYPNHNLVRCRTQFALVADMQRKWQEMNNIVSEIAAEIRK